MHYNRSSHRNSNNNHINECQQLADSYRLVPVTYIQNTSGELEAQLFDRSTARVELRQASFSTNVILSVTDAFPRFALAIGLSGKTKLFGDILGSSNVGYLNGRNGVLATVGADATWCNLSIDHRLLQETAETHQFQIPSGDGSHGLPSANRLSLALSLSQLARARGETSCSDAQFEDQLALLTLRALNPPCEIGNSSPSLRSAAVRRCVDYIHANFGHDLTVTELCKISGVSERTLQYAFTDLLGITPQRYLINYRLSQARTLLLTGGADRVADAMRACGMRHAQRFAQYFSRMYGILPSELLANRSKP